MVPLWMRARGVVVVGTSAGGMDALTRLVAQLTPEFPAPIFVVQHRAPDATSTALLGAMNRAGRLPCSEAKDGKPFAAGHVYLAPSDHHLLLTSTAMRVTKGARENRSRPAIDPLFRS